MRLFISYTRTVYQISELFYADNLFILSSVPAASITLMYIYIYMTMTIARDDSLANMGFPHRLYVLDDSKAHTGYLRRAGLDILDAL